MTADSTPPPVPANPARRRRWGEIARSYEVHEAAQRRRRSALPPVNVVHRLADRLPLPAPRRQSQTDTPAGPSERTAVKPQQPRMTARPTPPAVPRPLSRPAPPAVANRLPVFQIMAATVRRQEDQPRPRLTPPVVAVWRRQTAPVSATRDGARLSHDRAADAGRAAWAGLARLAARVAAVPRVTVAARLGPAAERLTPPAALGPTGFDGVVPTPPPAGVGLPPRRTSGLAPPAPKTPAPVGTPRGFQGADRATITLFVHPSRTGR